MACRIGLPCRQSPCRHPAQYRRRLQYRTHQVPHTHQARSQSQLSQPYAALHETFAALPKTSAVQVVQSAQLLCMSCLQPLKRCMHNIQRAHQPVPRLLAVGDHLTSPATLYTYQQLVSARGNHFLRMQVSNDTFGTTRQHQVPELVWMLLESWIVLSENTAMQHCMGPSIEQSSRCGMPIASALLLTACHHVSM